jgi:dTDP-4-amino-4,6-dideoxygalactose transaminase
VVPGDEVIIPGFGFPAAASAAMRLGARPRAVDVEPAGWNLDLAAAEREVNSRTRAIVTIDQFGLMAESAELAAFKAAVGVPILADAACALGATDSAGRPAGSTGELATFSFHPRKLVTCGEGGAVVCDDARLDAAVRTLRNLGQEIPGAFLRAGTNARLSEVAAAVAAAQLSRLDALLAERRLLAAGYRERLARIFESEMIGWQVHRAGAMPSYQSFAVLLAPAFSRERVCARLEQAGIESRPATYAAHLLPPFMECASSTLPVAQALHERALALPLYPGMRSAELDRVARALEEALS